MLNVLIEKPKIGIKKYSPEIKAEEELGQLLEKNIPQKLNKIRKCF